MNSFVKKWTETSLIIRILVFLIIGAILGTVCPSATVVAIFGKVFVGALKGIAPVLVFVLVAAALSKANVGIGSRFRTVIILYMMSTFLAAFVAVVASFIFKVTMVLPGAEGIENTPPSGIGEVLTNLLTNMVTNPVASIANANYIGILFWAVLLGLALRIFAKDETVTVFCDIADAVSTIVRWVIQFAPLGIMGLVFDSVSTSGLAIFKEYGKVLLLLVGCMLAVALIVDPLISFIFLRKNPYPLVFKCLKESGLTAFFTRSSAANIPVNMDLCKRLGLEEDFYTVSIPLGATINMDGAAITITIMTLATAYTMGIQVDLPTALILSVIATLGACGASGVAGGSLLLIPMACSLFGISNDIAMQAVAVGFIIGVVQDSLETALNSAGDVMFAATAEFHDRMKSGEKVEFFEK
ncbi:MAG: serine/threonine transporter SstT [Clostridiales bacterium]|nr:serine/threonine transporter SstT [Candidatus Crickella merdequi]